MNTEPKTKIEIISQCIEDIEGLAQDVNPNEIYTHLFHSTLPQWTNAWQKAINACIDAIKEVL